MADWGAPVFHLFFPLLSSVAFFKIFFRHLCCFFKRSEDSLTWYFCYHQVMPNFLLISCFCFVSPLGKRSFLCWCRPFFWFHVICITYMTSVTSLHKFMIMRSCGLRVFTSWYLHYIRHQPVTSLHTLVMMRSYRFEGINFKNDFRFGLSKVHIEAIFSARNDMKCCCYFFFWAFCLV